MLLNSKSKDHQEERGNLSATFAVKLDKDRIQGLEHICLLEEAYEEKKAESNAKEVALPCEAGVGFKKRKGSSTTIERDFGVEIRDQLDQEIARMFYIVGLESGNPTVPDFLETQTVVGKWKPNSSSASIHKWSSYREDDTVKANFVKEKIVNDEWWDKVSYILSFTRPIYEVIRACDTDKPCLNLVYEMWGSMIEKVKIEIYKKEKHPTSQLSLFYDVVHGILVARWAKNNTPLHCLAHSLNPRRNKLTTSRAQDLVYIHNNLRLLSRNPNDDVKMWDVGGDAFDSMEDSATVGDKQKMKQLEEAYEGKKAESNVKEVALPCEAGVGFKKRKGLPFNLARNPHYLRAFQFAAANKIDGYVPHGYNKLRTTLLQKEKDNVHKQLEPLRSTWKEKGVTIMSDSWSDPTRKPLINFMATSGNGPLFLKAVNCFGEVKDRFFIVDLMKKVINEIGHQNVMQIITDNAENCKAAGKLIESQFPHIYWTPCVVHTLNPAVKNICSPSNVETNALAYEQCNWIKDVHGDALAIKNFIMNHNMRLSIFSKFTPLRLLSVADTHFTSIIVMLKRLKLIKTGLQAMVISKEWSSYREDDTVKANFVKKSL
uniref:HAT dimerization domain, ribonuclease H-like domain protein n=1 Tax=Tanacetum cinerariifolium TaxID=118510 RepID=A0A6L2MJK0_TANCI|nr:hAT dimerization domain, ribonuclease H-like domain protein [Tanacetum cinerariifolium]